MAKRRSVCVIASRCQADPEVPDSAENQLTQDNVRNFLEAKDLANWKHGDAQVNDEYEDESQEGKEFAKAAPEQMSARK